MHRIVPMSLVLIAALTAGVQAAFAGGQEATPAGGVGGGHGPHGGGRGGMGPTGPPVESSGSPPAAEKPDKAAKKAFDAGVKSLSSRQGI